MEEVSKKKDSLDSLFLLRGIAVLMVTFCHFGGALGGKHSFASLMAFFHDYGIYGVHVFFVISGFVIPLSLFKGGYSIKDYARFLYKRVLRLHPPYLAALALTLFVMYLSYSARQLNFPETAATIFKSIFYLHVPADNPVFWTLLVEAQYYIFIGLFYALLIQYPKLASLVAIPMLLIVSQMNGIECFVFFEYIVFFLLGAMVFVIYNKQGKYVFNIPILFLILFFIGYYYSSSELIASCFSVVVILFFKQKVSSSFKFLGVISYSIYLIHFPIGIKFINFLKPKIEPSYYVILFLVTTVLIIIMSWIFYKIFESYSEKLSKEIRYKGFVV